MLRDEREYDFDVVVIGGGAIGLPAAWHAARMGQSVALLEQFEFGNQHGNSAGHVRMWRTAVTEPLQAQLALETGDAYREIESSASQRLLYKRGLLNFGIETDYTEQGTIETAAHVLQKLGKNTIRYSRDQLHRLYPFKNLPANYFGIYSEDNAVIDVKAYFQSMLRLNRQYGVSLHENEEVLALESEANGVVISTSKSTLYAKKVILSPGPYANLLTEKLGFSLNFLFWNMPFAYYKITDSQLEFPMWFQFDIPDEENPSKLFYGFPPVKFGREGFVRLAVDWASHKFSDLSERRYVAEHLDIALTQRYVKNHLRGVSSYPIDVSTALHAQLPDNLSVLDFMPENRVAYNKNIVLFTGGWAFKYAPLFGKICAQMAVEGGTEQPIADMAITRPGIIQERS